MTTSPNNQQTILIHANGTIQAHPARGRQFRLDGKWFRLAEQAYNDTTLGPMVYTECSAPFVAVDNVIPFRPRHQDTRLEEYQREAYAH